MIDAVETSEGNVPPILDIDPYAVPILESPYSFHERLRETASVVTLKPYEVYAVGRHAESGIVLSDHERFESSGGIGIQDIRKPGKFRTPSKLIEVDPPAHTEIRTAVNKILTPLAIRKWKADFESEAESYVDRIISKGTFDGVEDFVESYVMKVFANAVGVKLPRTETLAIGEMRFNQTGPENELYHKAMARAEPYLTWFEEARQRHNMVPGSIGDMLFEAEDRGEFPPGYAPNLLLTFVGGGTDSSISGICTVLHQLAANPEQWDILKSDPTRIRTALDEGLRFDTPFQIVYRTVRKDTELSGFQLEAGKKIGVFIGAANRDPRKWPAPDKFDLTRHTAGIHLAFGIASHNCIGQMIARLEAEALIGALLRKAKALGMVGTQRYRPMNQLRTLDYLPLQVTAA